MQQLAEDQKGGELACSGLVVQGAARKEPGTRRSRHPSNTLTGETATSPSRPCLSLPSVERGIMVGTAQGVTAQACLHPQAWET